LIGQKAKGKALFFLNFLLRITLIIPFLGIFTTFLCVYSALQVIYDVREMASRLEDGEKIEPGECSNTNVMFGLSHFLSPTRVILKEKKS
jgi:hypothetical protein